MSDVKMAEQLWGRAHELVRRGDFAQAVRDLAQCFQILQAANDPRVYEVHRRWTEVHQMYVEDGRRQEQPAPQKAPSIEAEAEAAANAGDLDRAITLYRQATQQAPGNELIAERLQELVQAKARATDLATGTAPPTAAAATSEDDWSDIAVVDERPAQRASPPVEARPAPAAATPVVDETSFAEESDAAPTMAVEDAPVGMQSLDVAFSVGEAIDVSQADELPVEGGATAPPTSAAASASNDPIAAQVALLEDLLGRVQANRRDRAA